MMIYRNPGNALKSELSGVLCEHSKHDRDLIIMPPRF
jgi:hypothetical protein